MSTKKSQLKLKTKLLLHIFCLGNGLILLLNRGQALAKSCTPHEINNYFDYLNRGVTFIAYEASECDSNPTTIDLFISKLKNGSEQEQYYAAFILGRIAEKANSVELNKAVDALIQTFKFTQSDFIRARTAEALRFLGEKAKKAVPELKSALKKYSDPYSLQPKTVKDIIVTLVVVTDFDSKLLLPEFVPILKNTSNKEIQRVTIDALREIKAFDKETIELLIEKLGDVELAANVSEALLVSAKTLKEQAKDLEQIEKAIAILEKIDKAMTTPQLAEYKQSINRDLEDLRRQQKELWWQDLQKWGIEKILPVLIAHPLIWLALIFAYPRFAWVQAFFFWNPWTRKFFGFGYVGFALAWVPFLRQRLFAPFRNSLLADADLENFDPNAYFPESQVILKPGKTRKSLQEVLPKIRGQVVLEGDSGLGKTLYLRYLVQQSKRIVVYLPAQRCATGVFEAVQAKLHGQAQDTDFLKGLIYSGAIDLCIDGLNEVNPDTRADIKNFVEKYFKGNIVMTTQPLEWSPPSTAKVYTLQPLSQDQTKQFLHSRQPYLPEKSQVTGQDYIHSCTVYLNNLSSDHLWATSLSMPADSNLLDDKDKAQRKLKEELKKAAERVISNPMDLTTIAHLIAAGESPNLFRLQEQQYELMETDYRSIHLDRPFPLKQFSEAVYQMRLNDRVFLSDTEFLEELQCMARHRLVVTRDTKDAEGKSKKEWHFRHDKITEFFIFQTFLGQEKNTVERLEKHLGDSRFRGVYFLLALHSPLDAAQELRETLIQYAADTKDHTVSDIFVQLLRSR